MPSRNLLDSIGLVRLAIYIILASSNVVWHFRSTKHNPAGAIYFASSAIYFFVVAFATALTCVSRDTEVLEAFLLLPLLTMLFASLCALFGRQ